MKDEADLVEPGEKKREAISSLRQELLNPSLDPITVLTLFIERYLENLEGNGLITAYRSKGFNLPEELIDRLYVMHLFGELITMMRLKRTQQKGLGRNEEVIINNAVIPAMSALYEVVHEKEWLAKGITNQGRYEIFMDCIHTIRQWLLAFKASIGKDGELKLPRTHEEVEGILMDPETRRNKEIQKKRKSRRKSFGKE